MKLRNGSYFTGADALDGIPVNGVGQRGLAKHMMVLKVMRCARDGAYVACTLALCFGMAKSWTLYTRFMLWIEDRLND